MDPVVTVEPLDVDIERGRGVDERLRPAQSGADLGKRCVFVVGRIGMELGESLEHCFVGGGIRRDTKLRGELAVQC